MQGNIPGGSGKLSIIVTAAVALTGLAALVACCLGEFFCFSFQQFVECLLHATADQFFDLTLDYFLVELYNVFGHGLSSPFECVCSNFILPETGKPCLLFCLF